MDRTGTLKPRLTLALLTLVYVVNFVDRQLVGILGQPMKAELALSDTQLGLLGGGAFALFYTVLGLPIARLAERRSRVGIITVSLALWSAMTALCGVAGSFTQLVLARIGVGIGEAGCAPASQSLVADLYPARSRATALSLLSLGIPAGMLVGAVAGGWLGQALGWRAGFIALGLPGIALAALLGLVLREPARDVAAAGDNDVPPPFAAVLARFRNPAVFHMAAGATLASFAGYGATSFAVPLLMRRYDLPLAIAAGGYGLVGGVCIGVGIGIGGWLTDRLGTRRPGAAGLVAAGGVLVAAALFQVALFAPTAATFGMIAAAPLIGAHLYFGPVYGVTANNVGGRERATAVAILLFAMNAIGLGLGPLAVGALSDHLTSLSPEITDLCRAASGGHECIAASALGLTSALRITLAIYVWAGLHFILAARAARRADPAQMPSAAR